MKGRYMPNDDDELFTDEGLAALAEQMAYLRRTGRSSPGTGTASARRSVTWGRMPREPQPMLISS